MSAALVNRAFGGRDSDNAISQDLERFETQNGKRAVKECAKLLSKRAPVADNLEALRHFCRRLFEARRFSWLISLEKELSKKRRSAKQFATIIGFYAFRAEMARQCYRSAYSLYERAVAPHRLRGAYAKWEERFIDEDLTNALMKQGRTNEARAVVTAALNAAPDHDAFHILSARLAAISSPAALLESPTKVDYRARGRAGETSLIGANVAFSIGRLDVAELLLGGRVDESRSPDFHLARANLAQLRGFHEEQRRQISAWFAHYGLWSPSRVGQGPFDIGSIAQSGLLRHTDGPLVSVIMCAYNAENTIDYAARSILDQTHANLELIIVDDLSTDHTRSRLLELAKTDSRVLLLFNETNAGPYIARNCAIQQAEGELLTFHDADDWRHPEHLAQHVLAMTDAPNLVASRSRWSRINSEGAFTLMPWGAYAHPCPAATMIRRTVFDEIGFFDSVRMGGDTEFWARIEAQYGATRQLDLETPLGLGLAHNNSLTTAGPGAFSETGASAPRLAYWEAQARWRDTMWLSEKPLYIPFPLTKRPFPAPRELTGPLGMDRPSDG